MNKVAFVTGSSRGIGRAVVEELLEQNYKVYGMARGIGIAHENYTHIKADLACPDCLSKFKFPDVLDAQRIVLFNNAGLLGESKFIGQCTDKSLMDGIHVNVTAPLVLMNKFIKKFQKYRAEKLVVNVSSGAAQNPYEGWNMYCASKSALDMMSEVVALEQKRFRFPVLVKAVAPGVVDTNMQVQIRASEERQFPKKEKFVQLKADNALYSTKDVALEYAHIFENPKMLEGVIHRIKI